MSVSEVGLREFALALLFVLTLASSPTAAQSVLTNETLMGIVPFVTTRAEIEERFGKPEKNGRYEFEEGSVNIGYRTTECVNSDYSCLCLAPIDTVLDLTIFPNTDLNIADAKLDERLWERFDVTGHVPGIEVYTNRKLGKTFSVNVIDGTIRSVEYEVSEKTCDELSKQKNGRPQ